MGLLDAYANDIERNNLAALRRPTAPPAEGFNLWAAGKAPVAGALDMVAGITDFLNLSGFSNALGSLAGGGSIAGLKTGALADKAMAQGAELLAPRSEGNPRRLVGGIRRGLAMRWFR